MYQFQHDKSPQVLSINHKSQWRTGIGDVGRRIHRFAAQMPQPVTFNSSSKSMVHSTYRIANNVFATTLNEDTNRSFIVGEHNNASATKSHHPRSSSHHLLQARYAKVLNSKIGFAPPGKLHSSMQTQRFEL